MKSLNALLSILLLAPVTLAVADDKGETHTATTDSAGTSVTTDSSHSESTGMMGTKKSETDEKTVVNPKGAMNEASVKKHTERKDKPNGDYSETATVKHANGTDEVVENEKSTSNHWTDRGKTTTKTHTSTMDPKGLGNKQKVEVKEKVDTNADGSQTKTVTKKVNGDTVAEDSTMTH